MTAIGLVPTFLAAALFSLSGSALSEPRSVRFEHLSRDQGLSQSFVYAIVQDNDGYMWFGTQEGLNRYDGFEFTVFAHNSNDPASISDDSIRTIIRDNKGALWVGTDAGGLSHYDGKTQAFSNYLHDPANPASISDNRVRVVYEDSSGTLWVGTDGSGLDRFDRVAGTFDHFPHDPSNPRSLSGAHVWDILEDNAGDLWIATDAGLNKFDPQRGTFTHFKHDPNDSSSIGDDELRSLYEDRAGNFWIGTASGGLNRLSRSNGSFERFTHDATDPNSISDNHVNTIYEDQMGVLWVGTIDGLNAWNPDLSCFDRYNQNPADRYSLAHNNVQSVYQDEGGVLWVGTYDGLSKWNQSTLGMLHFRNNVSNPHSLNENTVTSFAEDPNGDIWVGTYGGGLNVLDHETYQFRHIRHSPDDDTSLSSDRVMTLHVDSSGVLWAGTRAAGLNRYDAETNTFVRYRHDPADPDSISADGVTDILEDRNKGLWIATFGGGLNYFDRETEKFRSLRNNVDDPLALSNDRVLVLFEDSRGSIWAGTYGGGLNHLEPTSGTFTQYRGEPNRGDRLSGDEIYMVQEDAQGDLWIAAQGAGLNRWRRDDIDNGKEVFQHFGELDGLPSATIYSGAWDNDGALWLSTARGLSRLNTSSLGFRNYDSSHGLQGDEFNQGAGFRSTKGQLFFGGINGFNAFQPELLEGNRRPPPVVITAMLSSNDPVDLGKAHSTGEAVRLKHDQDIVTFRFAALDYAAPEKSRFMYQLAGLDNGWINAEHNRLVTYTHLPAGEYTFRVKAENNDGVWSERDAMVTLVVMPAPWRTWWAYVAYLFAAAGVAIFFVRTREKRTRQAAKVKYAEEISFIQARLTEAQRIAGLGNWELDTKTNELWWSDEIYRLMQMNPASTTPTYEIFLARVHPDDREAVKQALTLAVRGEKPYSIDHRIVREDGSERVVHATAQVMPNEQGEPVRIAGIFHDVTERKRTENDVRHRAEFQALLAHLSAGLIKAQPDDLDQQLHACAETVAARYDLDVVSIWWKAKGECSLQVIHRWVRVMDSVRQREFDSDSIPWISKQLLAGELVTVSDIAELPAEAAVDRMMLKQRGTKSFMIVPLLVDDLLVGSCVFSTVTRQRGWSSETTTELKLIAEILASAIARTYAVLEIRRLQDELQQENLYLRNEVQLAHGFDEIVGEDPAFRKRLQELEKVAPTDATVLLLGETGTGKELFARAIHKLSSRRDGPMVSVNCAALPGSLIESELFGHEKGAFTGAHAQRQGRFELANGGTLFFDEVGELPLELQSKLLRVLQTGEFERLGGSRTLRADVRVVLATNRNLLSQIEKGEFRADLYYRISSFPIRLPSLKDRQIDIPLLAEHFVLKHSARLGKKIEAISAKMLAEFTAYDWPGNVRELESIVIRAMISAEDNSVLQLPGPLHAIATMRPSNGNLLIDSNADLFDVERAYIIAVLQQTGWKISGPDGAAAIIGVPSSTLRSKMKRLGVTRNEDQDS